MHSYYLGIDTSNYTTSIGIVDENDNVVSDKRKLLNVKKGNRGLRQSEAFFQHIENISDLYKQAVKNIDTDKIKCVCVSIRPRNVEGSYMPVFKAGITIAEVISTSLGVPLYTCSHQEGHMKAITAFNNVGDDFFCYHMSGGTTEILDVHYDKKSKTYHSKIIGGTLDISIGQLIDRVGVALGMDFPAGQKMDTLACSTGNSNLKVKPIKVKDLSFNLSGIETQMLKAIDNYFQEEIAYELFTKINLCLQKTIDNLKEQNKKIVFVGGVSQSEFIRNNIDRDVIFGAFGSDNAIGTALIGGQIHGNKAY